MKKFVVAYAVLLAFFVTALVLSSLLPGRLLTEHIGASAVILNDEGQYPRVGTLSRSILLDNDTDALMLDIAYTIDSSDPLRSAMTSIRTVVSRDEVEQNYVSNLGALHAGLAHEELTYERYWHGYLVFLRPLLVFFSYDDIRHTLSFFLLAGLGFFVWLGWSLLDRKVTIALVIGLVAVDFLYMGQSIQFSSVFLLGIFASIYYLFTYKKYDDPAILFFVVGGLTTFFDLLTAPLVPLGFLLILTTSLSASPDRSKKILLHCLAWAAGYALLWSTKWFIVEMLFVPGALAFALDRVAYRITTGATSWGVDITHLQALALNLQQLFDFGRMTAPVLSVLGVISVGVVLRYLSFGTQRIKNIAPWLFIGALPYLWYFIAANHSYLHAWYTYREQFLSVAAFILMCAEFVDWERVKKDTQTLRAMLAHRFH